VGAYAGAITDPYWSAIALELQQRSFTSAGGHAGARVAPTKTLTVASPTASSVPSGAFTVDYQQQSVALERPSPTRLPGFGGAPP
jgi:hypothetical protein